MVCGFAPPSHSLPTNTKEALLGCGCGCGGGGEEGGRVGGRRRGVEGYCAGGRGAGGRKAGEWWGEGE